MKDKVNTYISIMKDIESALDKKFSGNQSELARKSGVSGGNVSKFLNEEKVRETGFGRNANNLLSVLIALDLIKSSNLF